MSYEVCELDSAAQEEQESLGVDYPALFISARSGEVVEKFRVDALKRMIIPIAMLKPKDVYSVYMVVGGNQKHIGYLRFNSLRTVIDSVVLKSFDFELKLDNKVGYKGDMLYTQCLSNI